MQLGVDGLLNGTYGRIGWSWDEEVGAHEFLPRWGPPFGADHFWPWFTHTP